MSERQKHPSNPAEVAAAASSTPGQLSDIRAEVDDIVTSARDSLRNLGLNNAAEFLAAARQSGGQ